MASIRFRDFSCYYKLKKGYAVAVDHISLDISDGELLVLVGQSGCGKTTLLRAIMNKIDLTDGQLLVDGMPIHQVKLGEESIAYVSQDYSLYPQMTVYENIAFPLRMMHTPQPEIDRRVKQIAGRLGIGWLLTRKPKHLSGGQHQRVAIARALVKEPRVLLFDEPFSNLEPKLRLELRQLVKQLHGQQRPTCVFVTHDLSEAFMLGERIAVMEAGQIRQIGTPQQLQDDPQAELIRRFMEA